MADHKRTIIRFKKTSSKDDRDKTVADLEAKGAKIVSTDNAHSTIFPFVVATLPEEHFAALHSECTGSGHSVVDHIEEDGEAHIM